MQLFGQEASVYKPPTVGMLGPGLRPDGDTYRNLKSLTLFISGFVSLHAFTAMKSWNVEARGNLLDNF